MSLQKYIDKAEILIEALPYITKFNGRIIVIKYGGSAMLDEELKRKVIEDIVLLKMVGFILLWMWHRNVSRNVQYAMIRMVIIIMIPYKPLLRVCGGLTRMRRYIIWPECSTQEKA